MLLLVLFFFCVLMGVRLLLSLVVLLGEIVVVIELVSRLRVSVLEDRSCVVFMCCYFCLYL